MSFSLRKKDAPSGSGAVERRRYPRLSSRAIVDLRPVEEDPGPGEVPRGVMQNISGGGVCVVVSDCPQVGSALAMKFHLEGSESPVLALGRVRWTTPTGDAWEVGIEFSWVGWEDPGVQERIRSFLTDRLGPEA